MKQLGITMEVEDPQAILVLRSFLEGVRGLTILKWRESDLPLRIRERKSVADFGGPRFQAQLAAGVPISDLSARSEAMDELREEEERRIRQEAERSEQDRIDERFGRGPGKDRHGRRTG